MALHFDVVVTMLTDILIMTVAAYGGVGLAMLWDRYVIKKGWRGWNLG